LNLHQCLPLYHRRLLLLGAAATTSDYSVLVCFDGETLCTQVHALEAFAWLAWVALTALLIFTFVVLMISCCGGRKSAWREEFGGDRDRLGEGNYTTAASRSTVAVGAPLAAMV
jgi:hypothetical protein